MKDSTKKLLNKQIAIMVKELEQIDDIKDRLELRVKVAQVIYNIGSHSDLDMPQGKDSIREDKAKEPVVVVEEDDDIDFSEEEDIPEIPEEMVNEVEPEPQELVIEEPEEVNVDEVLNEGADLKPEVAAQIAEEQVEGEELESIEESAPEVPEDVLEAYNAFVNVSDNPGVFEQKLYLATWAKEDGLDTIELYINYFADNIVEDENGDAMYAGEELHIDFLNDNNIFGFMDYVQALCE